MPLTLNPMNSRCSMSLPPTMKSMMSLPIQTIPTPPRSSSTISFHNSQPNNQPFGFLHNAEPDLLISLLEREHPQAIALVLAHLPPAKSGHLLARLSADTQTEVIRRLVDLQQADPAILREVEQAIEASLKARQPDQNRTAGMAAVTAILSASDHASRRQILHNLSVHDRPLAHQLTPPPAARHFTFSDVCHLSPVALVRVIHALDRRTAVLALARRRRKWSIVSSTNYRKKTPIGFLKGCPVWARCACQISIALKSKW